eukprot:TRINITY_DN7791_c0_g1_i1.p1 TRINITY_DN7791_c0_g1~~TRINITY_DN7791_c0_g1_i1.p1  ORF type:complete len:553 (+),score=84.75 TRINITY_DN7791_c0_g1_i1:42-1700(+)
MKSRMTSLSSSVTSGKSLLTVVVVHCAVLLLFLGESAEGIAVNTLEADGEYATHINWKALPKRGTVAHLQWRNVYYESILEDSTFNAAGYGSCCLNNPNSGAHYCAVLPRRASYELLCEQQEGGVFNKEASACSSCAADFRGIVPVTLQGETKAAYNLILQDTATVFSENRDAVLCGDGADGYCLNATMIENTHVEAPHISGTGEATHTPPFADVCNGFVLSNRWVVTAAHCLDGIFTGENRRLRPHIAENFEVGFGYSDITGLPTQVTGIKSAIIHPDYDPQTRGNDIALLFLDTSVCLGGRASDHPNFGPVPSLPLKCEKEGSCKSFSCSKFPLSMNSGDPLWIRDVQIFDDAEDEPFIGEFQSEANLIPREECTLIVDGFRAAYSFNETQNHCVALLGQPVCKLKDGDPVFRQATGDVLGIVSYRDVGCCPLFTDNSTFVLVRLCAYLDWIKNTIKSCHHFDETLYEHAHNSKMGLLEYYRSKTPVACGPRSTVLLNNSNNQTKKKKRSSRQVKHNSRRGRHRQQLIKELSLSNNPAEQVANKMHARIS